MSRRGLRVGDVVHITGPALDWRPVSGRIQAIEPDADHPGDVYIRLADTDIPHEPSGPAIVFGRWSLSATWRAPGEEGMSTWAFPTTAELKSFVWELAETGVDPDTPQARRRLRL